VKKLIMLHFVAATLAIFAMASGITSISTVSAEMTADLPACYADQIGVLKESQMGIVGSDPKQGSFNLDWTHEGTNANDGQGILFVRNVNGSQMDAAYVFNGRVVVSGNGWKIDGNKVDGGALKFTFADDGNSLTGSLTFNGQVSSRVVGARCAKA
jgi:hypothetical protein